MRDIKRATLSCWFSKQSTLKRLWFASGFDLDTHFYRSVGALEYFWSELRFIMLYCTEYIHTQTDIEALAGHSDTQEIPKPRSRLQQIEYLHDLKRGALLGIVIWGLVSMVNETDHSEMGSGQQQDNAGVNKCIEVAKNDRLKKIVLSTRTTREQGRWCAARNQQHQLVEFFPIRSTSYNHGTLVLTLWYRTNTDNGQPLTRH